MATTKILWAVKLGDPDWKEKIITETDDNKHLAKARKWAADNGFDRFRVLTWNGEKPDFIKAINI